VHNFIVNGNLFWATTFCNVMSNVTMQPHSY